MADVLIPSLMVGDCSERICVRASRFWDFCDPQNEAILLHSDLVLIDEEVWNTLCHINKHGIRNSYLFELCKSAWYVKPKVLNNASNLISGTQFDHTYINSKHLFKSCTTALTMNRVTFYASRIESYKSIDSPGELFGGCFQIAWFFKLQQCILTCAYPSILLQATCVIWRHYEP